MPNSPEPQELLRLEGIRKSFAGTEVLRDAAFALYAGEIRGLAGENGAGKSTLIKIIAGIWPSGTYEGRYTFLGRPADFRSVRSARDSGIAVIHQELALVPELSVAQNISLGNEPVRAGIIQKEPMRRRALGVLSALGLEIDPDAPVAELGTGERQLVEIAKALSCDFKVLILDEPTASLTDKETDRLIGILRGLREKGKGIVYVSHRMKEIFRLCDTVSVLRDGKNAGELRIADSSENELIRRMVGRDLGQVFPKKPVRAGDIALKVEDLTLKRGAAKLDLFVRSGEVLGLAGLVGSGRTELLEAVFGLRRAPGARLAVCGNAVRFSGPADAMRHGLALLSEERKETGLVLGQSVRHNITLASLGSFSRMGIVDRAQERSRADLAARELGVRCADMDMDVAGLSGGNQQKVALAKWALRKPRIFLLDEPTRGVDVGAKADIYAMVRRWTSEGAAVILASSELIELIGLSDRILALSDGSPAGEFNAEDVTEEELMTAMTRAFRAGHAH